LPPYQPDWIVRGFLFEYLNIFLTEEEVNRSGFARKNCVDEGK
jgi:hypothetical protein